MKQFSAKIEQAKALYVTLKPLIEDKYKFKSNNNIADYNKALETIKFGPEVVKNFVKDVENAIARIKEIDKIAKESKVRLIEDHLRLTAKKEFIIPKSSEIKDIYAALIYIPVSLAEIAVSDAKGNKINIHSIAESVLGTEIHLLCDLCLSKQAAKMLFVSTPDVCSVCGSVLCQDHTVTDSKTHEIICSDHVVVCSYCKNVVSSEKGTKCAFCNNHVCSDHVIKCSSCGKVICSKHSKKIIKKGMFKEEEQYKCPDHSKRK